MLALVERAVDLDRLFGSRHAFVGAAVREGAAGDREIGEKTRLEAEIADAARDLEAAPAYLDGPRRIDDRVEHAEIGVGAAGGAQQAGRFGHCNASLHLAHRLAGFARAAQAQHPWC